MLLAEVAATWRRVSQTRARLEKVDITAGLLGRAGPVEAPIAVAFLTGAPRQGKIGVGYRGIYGAEVAPRSDPVLALAEVDATFQRLTETRGAGSATERARLLAQLLGQATAEEQAFLRQLLVGELRQGALEGIMVDAIARAARVPARAVRRALMLCGDLAKVAAAALSDGERGLAAYRVELFCPMLPMLAQTAEGAADALERMDRAAFEYKLDGARIQVHRAGDDVRVFSRQLNDVTHAVPDVVEVVRALPAEKLILDGEAIALRPDGRPEAFQTTMRRFGRKRDVARLRNDLPLSAFFFDCLHADGQDFIDEPAEERFSAIDTLVPEPARVPRVIASEPAEADAFVARALAAGHEGAMAKNLGAPYEAGRRGASWLKIKPAHTLDLVVLAVEWGSGRRRGFLSNLHLGALDPKTGGFVMLGKTFKGMTDAMLKWQTERLLALETSRDRHVVFVRPELLVEVAFDGVQQSSQYPGGLALRFARVKRYRPDKTALEADTIDTVRAIHAGAPPR